MPETRIFTDRRCLGHRVPAGFPEVPLRLERILAGAGDTQVEDRADAGEPGGLDAALARTHGEAYLARLQRAVQRGDGLFDSADNPLSAGTWRAARAAAGAVLAAVDWVAHGEGRQAFAAVRPPGHHAERSLAMGFCYLNNVAVAAEHLRGAHGVERVAIVDFDVHHGNGTQQIFYERGEVLFVSLHRYPFYPGTGAASETGRGAGEGATLNLPMAAGEGDEPYRRAFDDAVLPALAGFRPQALLVSAGFDAWRGDPLGGMRVSERGYAAWGRRLGRAAGELCGGRVVSVLEGGYDVAALPRLVAVYIAGLAAGAARR